MHNVNSLIGAQGATFKNSFVNYSLCCPSRATFLTGQYAHNHGVIGNAPPDGGFDRFESLHGDNNLAVWLQNAGYYTALIGKYLNGYRTTRRCRRAGRSGTRRSGRARTSTTTRSTTNGTLVHYGHDPADFKQDVLTGKAVDFVDRRAPKPQPFFLWLTYTAPHIGGPNPNPNPPYDCGGAAKPAPRHAHAFDSEPLPMPPELQRGRRLRQAGGDPAPAAPERGPDRRHPAQVPLRAGVAALRRRGRQEGRRRARGERRARQHADRLHLRQRLLPRRAPDPERQAAHLRGVDPGAARDARPRHPAGGHRRPPGDQRRPGADDRRRGERAARAWSWTGAR